MNIETIKNEKGEVLKTKEGKELKRFTFEEGDQFIPQWTHISVNEVEVVIDGEKEVIKNYKLLCHVMDKNSNIIYDENNKEDKKAIFVTLTPTQAKSLQKKIDAVDEEGNRKYFITQHKFNAYKYYSQERRKYYIGVGFEPQAPKPKGFDDFNESNEEVAQDE